MDRKSRKVLFVKYLPIVLNFLIFSLSFTGFFLSCYFARRDGYSSWLRRLLYFTQQSNLWIGFTSLAFAVMLLKKDVTEKTVKVMSVLKYIFTVSITVTCLIFCFLLAPFADYNVWTFASVLTHVVVPTLAVLDLFTNKNIVKMNKKQVWLTVVPPLVYFVVTSVLCVLKVDFGRGDAFPYFFMNYYSQVGLFGFAATKPPQMGSFYWIVFLFLFIYALSLVYLKIHEILSDRRKDKAKNKS